MIIFLVFLFVFTGEKINTGENEHLFSPYFNVFRLCDWVDIFSSYLDE